MSDHTAIARQIYADLRDSAMHSLPTEQARERYNLWGADFDAVIAASKGYLRRVSPGLLVLAKPEKPLESI